MQSIILFGFKNCGKSTWGARAAQALGWDFVDTDHLLGENVAELYKLWGEEEFRAREREVVAMLAPSSPCVIALGGGTVVSRESVDHLQRLGRLVYLRVEREVLRRRSPPELLGRSFDDLYAERVACYEAIDSQVIDCNEDAEILSHLLEVAHGEQ